MFLALLTGSHAARRVMGHLRDCLQPGPAMCLPQAALSCTMFMPRIWHCLLSMSTTVHASKPVPHQLLGPGMHTQPNINVEVLPHSMMVASSLHCHWHLASAAALDIRYPATCRAQVGPGRHLEGCVEGPQGSALQVQHESQGGACLASSGAGSGPGCCQSPCWGPSHWSGQRGLRGDGWDGRWDCCRRGWGRGEGGRGCWRWGESCRHCGWGRESQGGCWWGCQGYRHCGWGCHSYRDGWWRHGSHRQDWGCRWGVQQCWLRRGAEKCGVDRWAEECRIDWWAACQCWRRQSSSSSLHDMRTCWYGCSTESVVLW